MNQYYGAAGLIPNDLTLGAANPNSYYGAAGLIPTDIAPGPVPTPITPEERAAYFRSMIAIHMGIASC